MKYYRGEPIEQTGEFEDLNSSAQGAHDTMYDQISQKKGINTTSLMSNASQDIVLYSICCAMAITIVVGTIGKS